MKRVHVARPIASKLSLFCGVLSLILGVSVLFGWYTHTLPLIQVSAGFVPMQVNTALGFLLSGLGLLLVTRGFYRSGIACGVFVILLGLFTLFEYVFGIDLGIDQLLMQHYITVESLSPGRMALNTAVGFLFAGAAMTVIAARTHIRKAAPISSILAALIFGLGFVALSGYLTEINAALLIIGILLALALSASVFFAQVAKAKERVVVALNNRLIAEISGRVGVEKALRDNEERWAYALEGNRDGVWDWNVLTDEVFYSRRWKEMFGFKDEEIGNSPHEWENRIHPDDKEAVLAEVGRYFDQVIPRYRNEHRVQCKDGSYKWVLDRGAVVSWTDDNKPQRMIGTHMDISDRKEAEASLQKSEGLYATLSAVNEVIARNENKQELFQKTCDAVVEFGGFSLAWIGVCDEDQEVIRLVAYGGDSLGELNDIECSFHDISFGQDFFARIFLNGKSVVFDDMEDNPELSPWYAQTGENRCLASAAFPLRLEERTIGVFGVCANDTHDLDIRGVNLLERLARNISFAIEKIEDQESRIDAVAVAHHSDSVLDSIFVAMPDLFFVMQPDGTIVDHRVGRTSDLHLPAGRFLGKRMQDVLPKSVGEQFDANLHIAAEQGGLVTFEYSLEASQKQKYWEARISQLPDSLQIIAIIRNITERRRAEMRVAHFRHLVESTLTEIYTFDSETLLFVDANLGARKNLGYTLEELQDMTPIDIKPEFTAESFGGLVKPLLTGAKEKIKFTTVHRRKNGSEYPVELSLQLMSEEQPVFVAMGLDISERNQAEITLRKRERELREILNSMTDAVITTGETGIITNFNNAAEKLFGYARSEVIGKNISRLIPEPYSSNHGSFMQGYLERGNAKSATAGREVDGQRKDQQVFPLYLSVAELPATDSGERRFIGSCHDLTKTKIQEEQLRRSQKMDALGKLTGGIAHDFNNMLGVVNGYADLLEGMLVDQPKLCSYAHAIHHAGNRGAKLTKRLLGYSRKEAPDAVEVDINTLLHQEQDMLQKTITVRNKLVLDLAEKLWPVWLDNHDLEDSIVNMCINGMHAMDSRAAGAQITIRTRNVSLDDDQALVIGKGAGDFVQLSVIDNGIGMDADTVGKIFDPFFSTKGETGTGLGLSQVIGFVERSGGALKVYAKPGEGSRFVLYFLRYCDDESNQSIEVSKDSIDVRGEESVLVVDDEPALRELASVLLGAQGYATFLAENADEALEILACENVDLLFSDVILPGMDGYQLATIVKEKYPAVKIQLVSGFSDKWDIELVDDELHNSLLNKPYKSSAMLKNIRVLLDA